MRTVTTELFSGGPGDSFEAAVIINTSSGKIGVAAESQFISALHGVREKDWSKVMQELRWHLDRPYDVVTIELANGTIRKFYFEISRFYR